MRKNLLINISKSLKPWGFAGMSIYDVAKFFWKGLVEGAITTRASSLAFNFFLAFFPSIIVLITIIPYIPFKGFQDTLMHLITNVLPPSTNEIAFQTLEDIINNPRGGLLSVGFLLALYFSTNGVNSLIEAFNSSYHIRESRPIIKQRILSLFLTFILSIILIASITLIIFGKLFAKELAKNQILNNSTTELIFIGEWFVLLSMLFFGISTLFYLAPSMKKQWKLFSPGAVLATIFIIITSLLFSYYINNFSDYNKIYGSIGTLMIILLWMYLNAIILLTGFELNASISNAKQKSEENYRDL